MMLSAWALGFAAVSVLPAWGDDNSPADTPADPELKSLQGEWVLVEMTAVLDGKIHKATAFELMTQQWSIEGTTIRASAHGSTGTMRFRLNPRSAPKEIDITALDGNVKGTVSFGIYDLQEGRLRVCMTGDEKNTEADRPKEFAVTPGSERAMMVFERKSP
jgi:uncharacterized protein (TIGR03067 family)